VNEEELRRKLRECQEKIEAKPGLSQKLRDSIQLLGAFGSITGLFLVLTNIKAPIETASMIPLLSVGTVPQDQFFGSFTNMVGFFFGIILLIISIYAIFASRKA